MRLNYFYFRYVKRYRLPQPTDCIRTLLTKITRTKGLFSRQFVLTGTGKTSVKAPDFDAAATDFLTAYREGQLGKFSLDKL